MGVDMMDVLEAFTKASMAVWVAHLTQCPLQCNCADYFNMISPTVSICLSCLALRCVALISEEFVYRRGRADVAQGGR